MYHIARNYDKMPTHQPWHYYLERMALTSLRGAKGGTGYMDGTVYREVLRALIHEGKTNATIAAWASTLNESTYR